MRIKGSLCTAGALFSCLFEGKIRWPKLGDDLGNLKYVNPLIGTRGSSPNDNGGMIPSVAPPFAMTRWTPQTRENYISQVPYSDHDRRIYGFQATHQPAIWMGEQGQVVITPGIGDILPAFEYRGMPFRKCDEKAMPHVYEVVLDGTNRTKAGWELTEQWAAETMGAACPPCQGGAGSVPDTVSEGAHGRVRRHMGPGDGEYANAGWLEKETEEQVQDRIQNKSHPPYSEWPIEESDQPDLEYKRYAAPGSPKYRRPIRVSMTATEHVGQMRFAFEGQVEQGDNPHIMIQASRYNWTGSVKIDLKRKEIITTNTQRQDWALGPDNPKSFKSYTVTRVRGSGWLSYGVTQGGKVMEGKTELEGADVGAFIKFSVWRSEILVSTAVSFISVEQARKNMELELVGRASHDSFNETAKETKNKWRKELDRFTVGGAGTTDPKHDPRIIFFTSLYHSLQYPSDFSEPTDIGYGGWTRRFYSGYTDSAHQEIDSYYQSWSLWDTYRAQHSLLTLLVPNRVNHMMRSLLRIFDWSGRLPLWANMVETNIMIATNAGAVLANALQRGFTEFNVSKAWEAVHKDAYVPPEKDTELLYFDREPYTPHEARAGLTSYLKHGWVDNDGWAESASRTLDYAFNDYAASVVAEFAQESDSTQEELLERSKNYKKLWNNGTQFMQARNANGSWANETWGWTEGDKWVYTFDVMHDVGGLASLFEGGRKGMKKKLDEHFQGGHNMHTNEPSHHVPYLYSMIGYPYRTAEEVRHIATTDYNATAAGLSGNEDLGQMSAWYVLSALGFYPVNPAGDEYIIGSPFFDYVKIKMPRGPLGGGQTLEIRAVGAGTEGMKYVQGVRLDGKWLDKPVMKHIDFVNANKITFVMSPTRTRWGTDWMTEEI